MGSSKITANEWPYAAPKLIDSGLLDVSDNDQPPQHQIAWREFGNPQGEPVLVVHGGPGAGCVDDYARYFDPQRFRVILFDQRGCGKSKPHISKDPQLALTYNTTDHLISDMNKLREARGITGKAHLFGGSWGYTLTAAYALKHPEKIKSLIWRGAFQIRREDLDYFYQGNAATYAKQPYAVTEPGAYQTYPEAWQRFVEAIPEDKRHDMVKAYAEIFAMTPSNAAERALQDEATLAWTMWEKNTSYASHEQSKNSDDEDRDYARAFAMIENHYFMNGAFLGGSGEDNRDQNYLLENMHKLKGHDIEIHMVHGRHDQVCPRNQSDALKEVLDREGIPANFVFTDSGHSMMDRENAHALIKIIAGLDKMSAVDRVGQHAPSKRPSPPSRNLPS